MLVPHGDKEFKHYASFLAELLKIRNKNTVTRLIEYQSNKKHGKVCFQPKIKINPQKRRLRHTFYVFGHGSQNGDITSDQLNDSIRCRDMLKYLNDLVYNARLRFYPKVTLTQCYGHLHINGSFPNISVDALSSKSVPWTLVHKSRNLSLMLHVITSWFQKDQFSFIRNKLTQKRTKKKRNKN